MTIIMNIFVINIMYLMKLKMNLNLLAKNLKSLKENKDFFNKDLEKNIYLNDKNHLINLNILNFNFKIERFFRNLKKKLSFKVFF